MLNPSEPHPPHCSLQRAASRAFAWFHKNRSAWLFSSIRSWQIKHHDTQETDSGDCHQHWLTEWVREIYYMLNTREKKDKATKHRKAPLRQQFSHPENLISQWWVTCRSSTVRPSRDQLRERQPLMHMQCQKNYGDNSRGKSNISPMACWSSNNLVFVHLKISKKKVAWIIYYDKMVAYDIPSSNQTWHTIYRSYSIKTSLCKGDFHGFPIAMFDQGFPSHAAAVNPRKPLQTWLLPRRGGCTWISGTPLGSQNMCCENGSTWYENWCKMQTVIWLAYITIYI